MNFGAQFADQSEIDGEHRRGQHEPDHALEIAGRACDLAAGSCRIVAHSINLQAPCANKWDAVPTTGGEPAPHKLLPVLFGCRRGLYQRAAVGFPPLEGGVEGIAEVFGNRIDDGVFGQ